MSEKIIEVSNLSYVVKQRRILQSVSFDIEAGEYLSIVGPNGAGKSTLLKCLIRILKPMYSKISIHGKNIKFFSQKELAKIVSYVPQMQDNLLSITVNDFVMLSRYPYQRPFAPTNSQDRMIVNEAMEITDTNFMADRYLYSLSGGERQRVLIAAALAQEPKILLLDEPATFLDPGQQEDIQNVLSRINLQQKTTIVAITHDYNRAALVSHRILALVKGEVVFHNDSEEFMKKDVLENIYNKSFIFIKHPEIESSLAFMKESI